MTIKSILSAGIVCLTILISCQANTIPRQDNITHIVDKLLVAYEEQDAQVFWNVFNDKLKSRVTLEGLSETLRFNSEMHGSVVSHKIDSSADGKRALVILEFERGSFDAHLRLDDMGKLARLTWLEHKSELTVTLTAEEKLAIKSRFSDVIRKLIDALEDTSGEAVHALLSQSEQSGWSESDCTELLLDVYDNCGLFKRALVTEPVSANKVVVPLEFQNSILALSFSIDSSERIYDVRISNYAPQEDQGRKLSELGSLAEFTTDLTGYIELKEAFNADSGMVRIVTILSPT